MTPFNSVRHLARSSYWQVIYSRSKEISNVHLFDNTTEFTPLQVAFMQWLEVYHSLEVDLACNKEFISREVIDDDIRCDAYLHWRGLIQNKSEKEIGDMKNIDTAVDGSVRFIQRPRTRK